MRKKLYFDYSNWHSMRNQGLMWPTKMERTVHTSVTEGEMDGRIECWNFCTKPPVMEARGRSASCSNFSFTPEKVHQKCFHCCTMILSTLLSGLKCKWNLTKLCQNFVKHVVEGPDIGCPVGMTQTPFKGEETCQNLWELTLKTRKSFQGLGVKSNIKF